MVPWNKLPKDVQKAILALIVVSGGSNVSSCCPPMVCDPPPPPKTALPSLTLPPIICDVMPPPSATRKPPVTPPVCDPAPPPSSAPRRTPTRPGPVPTETQPWPPVLGDPTVPPTPPPPTLNPLVARQFKLRSIQITTMAYSIPHLSGTVYDKQGKPLAGLKVALRSGGTEIRAGTTWYDGTYSFRPSVGTYQLVVGDDMSSALPLQLKEYDDARVDWEELSAPPQTLLPLAEIRTVDILWGDGLTFQVDTPWPGARCRWSVSGGSLTGENQEVTWEPPAEPGRYLLQLVADWGYEGLAVDSLVLTVNRDGSIFIS